MGLIEPGIYRISGKYSSVFVGIVEVFEVTPDYIKYRKEDGQEARVSRFSAEAFRWKRFDQAAAYGNDCRDGRCET